MANKNKTQPKPPVQRQQVASLGEGVVKMPLQALSVELSAESVNDEKRTIDAVFYSGAQVARMDWWTGEKSMLQFSLDPAHIRMGRLNSGAPVLNCHSAWSLSDVFGVVEKAWLEAGKGMATLRFSDREEVEPVWRDVKNKILRNVSMGAAVHKLKDVTPDESKVKHFLAVDWEPMEISAVPIGADPGAGFLRDEQQQFTECEVEHLEQRATAQEEPLMKVEETLTGAAGTEPVVTQPVAPSAPTVDLAAIRAEAAQTERLRIDGIQKSVKLAGLDVSLAEEMVKKGISLADARTEIFNKLAERSEANPIRSASVSITRDADVTRLACMENQLLHRLAPDKVKLEGGREYAGQSLFELLKENLSEQGIRVKGLSKLEIVRLGLRRREGYETLGYQSTSDFPSLLANVAAKRLRAAYEENPASYRRWARRAPNAPDFKQMSVVVLSNHPDLLRTNEHGEFQYSKLTDGKEVYSLLTYGRILPFTRQSIINDDLRGFDRLTTGFGASAARLENRTVYAELTNNAVLSDSVALFDAVTHKNYTTPGTAISVASLGVGRAAMRLQKGLAAEPEELNLSPRFLLVPAALEQIAYQFTSSQYVPAKSADTNEFRTGGRTALEPVVESVLDANSSSKWYLAADTSQIDTVEYCFLDGNEGVFIEQEMGFDIDGMKIKARLDFAAKALDYRGLYLNAGA